MINSDILIEKYFEHRKVHESFLQLFSNLFETVMKMQTLASDVSRHYDAIFEQLKLHSQTPPVVSHKRRKAHSIDSPSNIVRALEETSTARNKSDSELSSSILNQNINLPDSDESFFALTQTPTRTPLSPKVPSGSVDNVQYTPPRKKWIKTELCETPDQKLLETEKKKKKHNLSLNRFSSALPTSPETNKQIEQLPVRAKMATPKTGSGEQQENVVPAGKWTVKKGNTGSASVVASNSKRTPTPTGKNNSLLNRTRLRQTKLRFPDNLNKSDVVEDQTYFDDFVVPSPTAFSGSRFLKSIKKREQSSLIGDSKSMKVQPQANPPEDDHFDIDQTYFSEAEKDLTRQTSHTSCVKKENLFPKKIPIAPNEPVSTKETKQINDVDSDTSSVLFVNPPAAQVIVIEETQPNQKDLFMEAIREQRRKQEQTRQSVLSVMAPAPSELKQTDFASREKLQSAQKPLAPERRCGECNKHYDFLVHCGLPVEVIRSKMVRNCRECRNVQLHETPIGFWNPEFSPTQE
ncbi:uncharacterized protein LOC129723561 [Wyeomyia smithii]|uniref:uncharacterized protein LOC129723561 n=1 Tax=Wyeomyia smithii TaxID=174621 RepID=UPI0024681B83|nr:uncharacterized protein LOC129723561 [Wyeomyia smithii]XP_055533841.1 uncharacterized protein LOC129723561 [Wyeomyia smithii]XP_055533842.1 uncharacterized protein LOC129723561 [Wyeomyia smithii]